MGILELPRVRNWSISHHRSAFQETEIPELFGDTGIQRGMDDSSFILGLGGLHWVMKICTKEHTHPICENHIILVTPPVLKNIYASQYHIHPH